MSKRVNLKSIPDKAKESCLSWENGSLLTSRDSDKNGPGIKHAFQCVNSEKNFLALFHYFLAFQCVNFKHFLALFWPPDLKQKVQTRQFAYKFNLGLKFGAESLIHRRGKRQAK